MVHKEIKGDCCPKCNGSGTVVAEMGWFYAEVDCPDCAGTGLVNSPNACKECKGAGTVIVGLYDETVCGRCNGSGLEPKTPSRL